MWVYVCVCVLLACVQLSETELKLSIQTPLQWTAVCLLHVGDRRQEIERLWPVMGVILVGALCTVIDR